MMLGREGPVRLREISKRLDQLETQVPAQAVRFRTVLAGSMADCDDMLAQRIPIFESGRVSRLEREAGALEAMAPELATLIRAALAAREKGYSLAAQATGAIEPPEATIVRRRSEEWAVIAGRIGSNADRVEDIEPQQQKLKDLQGVIEQHEKAVDLLREGGGYLRDLSPATTAHFEKALAGLKRRFEQNDPDAQWLAEFEQQVQPLRDRIPQAQTEPVRPPEALRDAERLLSEARRWSEVLETLFDRNLEDRLQSAQSLASLGRPVNAEELFDTVRKETERLRTVARDNRDNRFHKLDQNIKHYQEACGDLDEPLPAKFTALREGAVDSPVNYSGWMARFRDDQSLFNSFAARRESTLREHLVSRLDSIERGVKDLVRQELTVGGRRELERLEGGILQLRHPADLDKILEYLADASRFRTRLAELETQARREFSEYQVRKLTLLNRNQELQQASTVADIQCQDFAADIEKTWTHPSGLDRMIEDLDLAERGLEAEIRRFLKQCGDDASRDYKFCFETTEILKEVHPEAPVEFSQAMPNADELGPAAQQRRNLQRSRGEVEQRVADCARDLDRILETAHGWFENLLTVPGGLSPAEAAAARSWSADFKVQFVQLYPDAFSRIQSMMSLYRRHKSYVARLGREETEVRRMHGELQRRFREFTEEELRIFFSEPSERVSALLYGVDLNSGQWQIAKKQIALAGELFTRLDSQSRRCAARRLESATEKVREHMRSTGNPQERTQMREALNELQAFSTAVLPPLGVRQRILQLAEDLEARGAYV